MNQVVNQREKSPQKDHTRQTSKQKHVSKQLVVLKWSINILAFLLVPIILFYLMEAFEHNAYEEVRSLAQVYNIFLFELIAGILLAVSGSGRIALSIETGVAFLYGLVNHYVMAFRSTPLVPWDIFSIQTAASVAGNYDFTPTKEMLFVCAGFVVLFVLIQFMDLKLPIWKRPLKKEKAKQDKKFSIKRLNKTNILVRLAGGLVLTLVFCSFVNLLQDEDFQNDRYLYPFLFTPAHMTKVNGMAVTFAMDMAFVYVERPDGYSIEEAQRILAEYQVDTQLDEQERKDLPNVIVIMNEAFSDLAVLGGFTTNEDYMPYVHGLQEGAENTRTGMLTVSVCGGNTANSEFEFLTGHTMDYFPVGSIPYQQYIKGEMPSLASHLKELGYATYGMHPYNASGWERDKVYPWFGFETSYFLQDFTSRYYIRSYVSDRTAYNKIIETYENRQEDQPLFVFQVTMQNHGGYTDEYKNFSSDILLEDVSSKALEQYLSLVKISDAELERLIAYFSVEEDKTILLFFGDHQPNDYTVNPILRFNGKNTSLLTPDEAALRYQVPYVMWANFDIEEEKEADLDIQFLATSLLKEGQIPMNAYQNFLAAYEKNPELMKKQQEILQYYFMFDYKKEQ